MKRYTNRIILSFLLVFTLAANTAYFLSEAMAGPDAGAALVIDAGISADAGASTAGIATSPISPETAGTLYEALRDRRWIVVVGIGMVLLVWGLRKIPFKNIAFFQTKIGGWLLAFTMASAVEFGAALSAGQPPTFALLVTTLGLTWTASGGWSDLKDVSSWMKKRNEIPLAKLVQRNNDGRS
jgi:hypothetical protein